jgi:hypothetical protein
MSTTIRLTDEDCSGCGKTERLEKVGEHLNFCATCAADWRGYVFGCQSMALYAVGQAVVAAQEEDLTAAQIARYVQCALDGDHHRDEVHQVVGKGGDR